MSHYTIADLKAGGVFVRHLSCGKDQLRYNVAEHEFAIEGRHCLYSKRYDETTAQVVDYVPPQPDANHEWDETSRRWRKRADVIEREHRRAQALARIEQLERKQLRPMRELAADPDNDTALGILAEIDAEIAKLRETLRQ